MAKIIKVGSQNPTFTSVKANKANTIKTHRNSNEATNPFKFTNFEGKTLPFELAADVFETKNSNKLKMVATSVTGSMNKIKSNITESIVNFVNRVRGGISSAWNYANTTAFTVAISDATNKIKDNAVIKSANEILNTPIKLPPIDAHSIIKNTSEILNTPIKIPVIDNIAEKISGAVSHKAIDMGNDIVTKWNGMISNISFHGRHKYADKSVAELETLLVEALAEGGINE